MSAVAGGGVRDIHDLIERLGAGLEGVTPGPWQKGTKRTVGYVNDSDDQSDGMLIPIADVYGENPDADLAWIALCSPDNIRALLSHIAALSADLASAKEALELAAEDFRTIKTLNSHGASDQTYIGWLRSNAEQAELRARTTLRSLNKEDGR